MAAISRSEPSNGALSYRRSLRLSASRAQHG
jgi:hypothetical protein